MEEEKRNKEGINFSDGIGIFKARAREFFSRFSAEINSQFQHSISYQMKVSEDRDLVSMLKNIVQTELKDEKDTAQDRTWKVSQMSAPQDYSEEIETLISSVSDLKTQMRSVMSLLESLID